MDYLNKEDETFARIIADVNYLRSRSEQGSKARAAFRELIDVQSAELKRLWEENSKLREKVFEVKK